MEVEAQPHGACQYFLEKKLRYCKMEPKPGHAFCGLHLQQSHGGKEPRVRCPYGNHDVYASALARHLHICQDYKLQQKWANHPCCVKGINAGSSTDCGGGSGSGSGESCPSVLPDAPPELADRFGRVDTQATRRLALTVRLGPTTMQNMVERIERAEAAIPAEMDRPSVLSPASMERFNAAAAAGERPHSAKHVQQHASIVANMERWGLLRCAEDTTFVEFGAGKGYLTCMLGDCCEAAQRLVMMDVRCFSKTADRSLRDRQHLQRLRCDLSDFEPAGVEGFTAAPKWCGIGKHLCGAATDLALRCCVRRQSMARSNESLNGTSPSGSSTCDLLGLAVATCCHHRCAWEHYVGKEAFAASGFGAEDFEAMSYMTGWALCGHGAPAEARGEGEEQDQLEEAAEKEEEGNNSEGAWRPHHSWSRAKRIAIGRRCKRLLDWGRVKWLEDQGFKVTSVQYCDAKASGENRLLLAVPGSGSS